MIPSQKLRILLVAGAAPWVVIMVGLYLAFSEPQVPKAAEAVPFCLVPDAGLFMSCGNKELSL